MVKRLFLHLRSWDDIASSRLPEDWRAMASWLLVWTGSIQSTLRIIAHSEYAPVWIQRQIIADNLPEGTPFAAVPCRSNHLLDIVHPCSNFVRIACPDRGNEVPQLKILMILMLAFLSPYFLTNDQLLQNSSLLLSSSFTKNQTPKSKFGAVHDETVNSFQQCNSYLKTPDRLLRHSYIDRHHWVVWMIKGVPKHSSIRQSDDATFSTVIDRRHKHIIEFLDLHLSPVCPLSSTSLWSQSSLIISTKSSR